MLHDVICCVVTPLSTTETYTGQIQHSCKRITIDLVS